MTVPNQRKIIINKEETKGNLYYCIKMENLEKAMEKLKKPGAIKLYLYFSKNQPGYEWELSGKAFEEWGHVSGNTYSSAFAELVEKGYLVRKNEGSNVYYFYDNLERAEEEKKNLEEKRKKAEAEEEKLKQNQEQQRKKLKESMFAAEWFYR